jgi:hypothetical protein
MQIVVCPRTHVVEGLAVGMASSLLSTHDEQPMLSA